MKKMQLRAVAMLAGLACIMLSACHDNDTSPDEQMPDSMVFGDYYGECAGNGCIDLYKIEGGAVYEDTKDAYPSQTVYSGQFARRADVSAEQVKSLLENFPEQLYDESEITLGMPDAGDWGGYYIEVIRNNTRRFWLIDKQVFEGDRAYLNTFTAQVQAKLNLLEEDSTQ